MGRSTLLASVSREQLEQVFASKYLSLPNVGWGPKLRSRFGYYTPDDCYEALVSNLVGEGCYWADVGCGRDIFPSNARLAQVLTERAGHVLGIDPDPNVRDNPYLSEAAEISIEDYVTDKLYDLVTLRMVAEHIRYPDRTLASISAMLKPGGVVVVYTPHKWAPMSLLARSTPITVHHFFKRILWNTEERDTFPVQFRMNSRDALSGWFARSGMREVRFDLVDDCRVFQRFYALNYLELSIRKACNVLHVPYPERCILAVYEKPA